MTNPSKRYDHKLRFEGALLYILVGSAVMTAAAGWIGGVLAVFDDTLGIGPRLVVSGLLAIAMGTLLPLWIVRLNVRIKVEDDVLSARLWPFRATVVLLDKVTNIEQVTVDPLREYGGWGIKGSAKDRLYGTSGIEAVRVTYAANGSTRKMTILTDDAPRLADALHK